MGSLGVVAEVKGVSYHWWQGTEPEPGASHFEVTAQVAIGSADSELVR